MSRLILVTLILGAAIAVPLTFEVDYLAPQSGARLLQFNESVSRWVSPEEEIKIIDGEIDCGNFMDITNHQHDIHPRENSVKPSIPTKAQYQSATRKMLQAIDADRIISTVTDLSTKFRPTRYYKSQEAKAAAEYILGRYVEITTAAKRSDISSKLFPHSWTQPSVITKIEGQGPRKEESVILSSHIDSISKLNAVSGVAPGADDDASGTGTVLEVFRVLVESGFKFDRTIEFHGYSAEEVGLLGSQDVVADYIKRDIKVAAQVQLDMDLYQYQYNTNITLIEDFVSVELTNLLETLAAEHLTVNVQKSKCGYACSDHASWHKGGFTAAFPFETAFSQINKKIHTDDDVVAHLNKEHGLNYAKLATAYLIEVAGLAH